MHTVARGCVGLGIISMMVVEGGVSADGSLAPQLGSLSYRDNTPPRYPDSRNALPVPL